MKLITLAMLIPLFVEARILVPNVHGLAKLAPTPVWIVPRQNGKVLVLGFRVVFACRVLENR